MATRFLTHGFCLAGLETPDERPAVRTLKRHMAKLKRAGLVQIRKAGMSDGMVVVLLGSAKWRGEVSAPARQLPLYAPQAVSISRAKAVGIQRKTGIAVGTNVALSWGQKCPRKEVRSKTEEKISRASRSHTLPRVEKTEEEISERRRELANQLEMLQKKYKSAG